MKPFSLPVGVAKHIQTLRNTDTHFAEFLKALHAHRDELLRETMKSGVNNELASEYRYAARGVDDVIACIEKGQ